MESPPSYSNNSEPPLLSDDSGLFLTSGSFSSDSASGWHHITSELQESDYDEKSLSLCESVETSERMCGDNFNTVKKGPAKVIITTIEPPPEFQDFPAQIQNEDELTGGAMPLQYTEGHIHLDNPIIYKHVSPMFSRDLRPETIYERRQCLNHRFASPRLLHLSPCRSNRPASRNSLTSRLSSSHNSLITQFQIDDSTFITQAISHDTLSAKTSDITDMYNVPFDSDIYAVPIDMIRPNHSNLRHKSRRSQRNYRKRGKSVSQTRSSNMAPDKNCKSTKENYSKTQDAKTKRHSLPGPSAKKSTSESGSEPLNMTLREVRKYLHTLYSSSSDSECKSSIPFRKELTKAEDKEAKYSTSVNPETALRNIENNINNSHKKSNKNTFGMNIKSKKHKDACPAKDVEGQKNNNNKKTNQQSVPKTKSSPVRILSINIKQSFCNLFRWRRNNSSDCTDVDETSNNETAAPSVLRRALPPLPTTPHSARKSGNEEEVTPDFATSIQRVKDYGWYWGPLSVESAEKILSNEPDGSFIVRDSSDDHYIFTLTFKLNGLRHVRIEHEQGNFCFGGCTMFKAQTIVEFIENAVETSRSGRYLFFLNLRPVLGPVRVQLLYPVSRFKRVQSLQHMCRFVILKHVRRDLIGNLPLPRRLLDYLNATHYYSELLADI